LAFRREIVLPKSPPGSDGSAVALFRRIALACFALVGAPDLSRRWVCFAKTTSIHAKLGALFEEREM
jgi:hypothetical protein